MLVLNKADLLDDERRHELAFRHPDAVLVSALTGEGLDALGERIAAEFERTLRDVELLVPFSEGGDAVRAARARRRPRARGHRRGRAGHASACRRVIAARFVRYAVNGNGRLG